MFQNMIVKLDGDTIVMTMELASADIAKLAKETLKQSINSILPRGWEKLVKEIRVSQDDNKLIFKYVMIDSDTAECFYKLSKKVVGNV